MDRRLDTNQFFEAEILQNCPEVEVATLYGEVEDGGGKERRDGQLLQRYLEMYSVVFDDGKLFFSVGKMKRGEEFGPLPQYSAEINTCKDKNLGQIVRWAVYTYRDQIWRQYRNHRDSQSKTNFLSEASLKEAYQAGIRASREDVFKDIDENRSFYKTRGELDYNTTFKLLQASWDLDFIWIGRVNAQRRLWHAEDIISKILEKAGIAVKNLFGEGHAKFYEEDEMTSKLEVIAGNAKSEFDKYVLNLDDDPWEQTMRDKLTALFENDLERVRSEALGKNGKALEEIRRMMSAAVETFRQKYIKEIDAVITEKPFMTRGTLREEHERRVIKCVRNFLKEHRFVGNEAFRKEYVTELKRRFEETFTETVITKAVLETGRVAVIYVDKMLEDNFKLIESYSRNWNVDEESKEKVKAGMRRFLQGDFKGLLQQEEAPESEIRDDNVDCQLQEAPEAGVKLKAVPILDIQRDGDCIPEYPRSLFHGQSLASFTIQFVSLDVIRVGFILNGVPHVLGRTSSTDKADGWEWRQSNVPLLVGMTKGDCFIFGDEVEERKDDLRTTWNVGKLLRDNWLSNKDLGRVRVGEKEITIQLEFLFGIIFRNVKNTAEGDIAKKFDNASSNISKVIIVVPPRLLPFQREQLKHSAVIAGFKESRIVNATSCLVYDGCCSCFERKSWNEKKDEILVISKTCGNQCPQLNVARYKFESGPSPGNAKVIMEEYIDDELATLVETNASDSVGPSSFPCTLANGNVGQIRDVVCEILQKKLKLDGGKNLKKVVISCMDSKWLQILQQVVSQLYSSCPTGILIADAFSELRGGMWMGGGGLWEDRITVEDRMTRCISIVGSPNETARFHIGVNESLVSNKDESRGRVGWIHIPKQTRQVEVSYGLSPNHQLELRVKWGKLDLVQDERHQHPLRLKFVLNREGILKLNKVEDSCGGGCPVGTKYTWNIGNQTYKDVTKCIDQINAIFHCSLASPLVITPSTIKCTRGNKRALEEGTVHSSSASVEEELEEARESQPNNKRTKSGD